MIAPVELPVEADGLAERASEIARELMLYLRGKGREIALLAGDDVLSTLPDGHLFLADGFLALGTAGRVVRYFESGLFVPTLCEAGLRFGSEFSTRGEFFSTQCLCAALATNAEVLATWLSYERVQAELLACICAQHAAPETELRTELSRVAAGELIVTAGQRLSAVLVLVEGCARAEKDGVVLGDVNCSEFIGEVSFFTDTACIANVRAVTDCTVQSIPKEAFHHVVRHRPETMVHLATTLAERLTRANLNSLTAPSLPDDYE